MHIFQIRVAKNNPTGPCVNGQGQEFVIAFVATDKGLRSDLEKLNRLGNFDQMAQAAKASACAVVDWGSKPALINTLVSITI